MLASPIVPTLRVGMQPSTLCVHLPGRADRQLCDAERHEIDSHAERGSHQDRAALTGTPAPSCLPA
ncbi:RplA family protein (modular protein) [Pseudomonas sp. 8AS]|nr:RplA family protein (modular protein) [Pseudomonas sp. 8AS]